MFQKTTVAPSIKHISTLANFIILFVTIAIGSTSLQGRSKKNKQGTKTAKIIYKKKHKTLKIKTTKENQVKFKTAKRQKGKPATDQKPATKPVPQPTPQPCIQPTEKKNPKPFYQHQMEKHHQEQ